MPAILERIRKPIARSARYLVVIYAKGGTGKTTLLGTMPGRGLVLDIPDFEGGDMVLVDKSDRIDIAPIETWEELNEVYLALKRGKGSITNPKTNETAKYDWIAIDSITATGQLARRKVIREREDIASKPYTIRLQDWGGIGQLQSELFEKFRTLRMPVLFTAQERSRREDPNDPDSPRIIIPNISPAALDNLVPHPILIGRLFVVQSDDGKWERRLRVGPHADYITKARSVPGRMLPDVIRRPNLGQIVAYMRGEDVKKPRRARDEDEVDLSDM